MTIHVIVSSEDWFANHPKTNEFDSLNLRYITKDEDLNLENLKSINPKYIFFTHWSLIVKPEIYENFDLPVIGWSGSNVYYQNINNFQVEAIEQKIHPRLPKVRVEYYFKY